MINGKFADDYLAEISRVVDVIDKKSLTSFNETESFIRIYVKQVDADIAADMLARCAELRGRYNASRDSWAFYDLLTMLKNNHTYYIWPLIEDELKR